MIFPKFPKTRPPLPEVPLRLHEAIMLENREGKSLATKLSKWFERWLHVQVVKNSPKNLSNLETLEIGAGRLNHLEFEQESRAYDIVEPRTALYELSPNQPLVRDAYSDISHVPNDRRYDRVISIAVLEHLTNLPSVVARAGLLLKPEGIFLASIPSEGEFLWHLACSLTTGLEYRLRTGYSYKVLMKHEHVNTAREVNEVLSYFFEDVKCTQLGPFPQFSIYQFFKCSKPDLAKCEKMLLT